MEIQYRLDLTPAASMNAPLLPEVLLGADASAEPELPLATEGVQRTVWQSRYGAILIEVKDGVAYVNGQPVEPLRVTAGPPPP
jgi:hypothetical protein